MVKKEYVTLKVSDLIPYENNPRTISKEAIDAVAESVKQCGYIAPIIVDENNVILAGHTRLKAISKLGWDSVEVERVIGLSEMKKKKYRLLDNKTGEFSKWDYARLEEEMDGLDFLGFDFGFFEEDVVEDDEEDEEKYTTVINIPQYEITGEQPSIDELCDSEKAEKLIEAINESDADEDVKEFLRKAACRHYGFNYSKIAEFYAHQNAEIQKLMEESALVIIDYDDAIRNGFAELSNKFDEIMGTDEDEG